MGTSQKTKTCGQGSRPSKPRPSLLDVTVGTVGKVSPRHQAPPLAWNFMLMCAPSRSLAFIVARIIYPFLLIRLFILSLQKKIIILNDFVKF